MSTVCDPVVVAFPGLVDDPHMRVMLHRTWDDHVKPLDGVRLQEVVPGDLLYPPPPPPPPPSSAQLAALTTTPCHITRSSWHPLPDPALCAA